MRGQGRVTSEKQLVRDIEGEGKTINRALVSWRHRNVCAHTKTTFISPLEPKIHSSRIMCLLR